MSAIKRYLEDVCTTVTDAIEIENSDRNQYSHFVYGESDSTEEAVMLAIIDGQWDRIFSHLIGCWTECLFGQAAEQKPLTYKALCAILPHVSDEILSEFDYTRSPVSLVGDKVITYN